MFGWLDFVLGLLVFIPRQRRRWRAAVGLVLLPVLDLALAAAVFGGLASRAGLELDATGDGVAGGATAGETQGETKGAAIFDFLVRSYKNVSIPSNNSQLFSVWPRFFSPLCLAMNSPAPGLLLSLCQHFPSDRHLSATSPRLYSTSF